MVSLLFPKGCVLCGGTVAFDDLVCERCLPDRLEAPLCDFCGKPSRSCACLNAGGQWAFEGAAAALHYREETRGAVIRLKKLPERRIARYFAGEMLFCMEERLPGIPFDFLTEVPMHPDKLERRGFNQAELIAAELSALTGIFHRLRLLACAGEERPQHELNRAERFAAAREKYRLVGKCAGKTVLLIDDVMTTGATAQACAACLMEGGAAEVYVLTAASTDKI